MLLHPSPNADLPSRRWEWWFRLPAFTAVACLCAASAVINARFGFLMGEDHTSSLVLLVLAVALDVFKWFAPLAIAAAIKASAYILALVSCLLWLLAGAWSFAAAISFSLTARQSLELNSKSISDDQARATVAWTNAQRAVDTLLASPTWTATNGCSNVTLPKSRSYCAELAKARADLSAADQRLQLAPPKVGDAFSRMIAQHYAITIDEAQTLMSIAIALIIELFSMLGFYAVTPARAPKNVTGGQIDPVLGHHSQALKKPAVASPVATAASAPIAAPAAPKPYSWKARNTA